MFRVSVPVTNDFSVSVPMETVLVYVSMGVVILVLAVAVFYIAIPAAFVFLICHLVSQSQSKKIIESALVEAKGATDKARTATQKAGEAQRAAKENSVRAPEMLEVAKQATKESRESALLAQKLASDALVAGRKNLNKETRAKVPEVGIYAKQAAVSAKEAGKYQRSLQLMVAQAAIKGALKNGAGFALNKLKSAISGDKQENSKLANALMAMCALVASADDHISEEEKEKIRQMVTTDEVLKSLDSTHLIEFFNSHCAQILADNIWGSVEAKRAISEFKGQQIESDAIIQIGILVAQSDDDFSFRETGTLKEACQMLNLNPSTYGL